MDDNVKNNFNNWTEEELNAYVLIFAMNANKLEKTKEFKIISDLIDVDTLKKMSKEFDKDSFDESIQKINICSKRLHYSKDKIQDLFNLVKRVFDADNDFSIRERNLTYSLKRAFEF